jgi:predicted component of type VI protein secretion system
MHFPWDKVLPKFIVLRVRRSTTKSGGSQSNSPVTRRAEGDCSVSAGIPSAQPGHFVSASSNSGPVVSSTGSSRAFSEAFDIAQVSLPVVQAAAEAIPIAGAPMKAAIGGLLAVLQAIDVSLL